MKQSILLVLFCILSSIFSNHLQAQKDILSDTTIPTPAEDRAYQWQRLNRLFYNRVTQFSDLSWVSPPYMDWGSEKGRYILSADISPHFFIGGERIPVVFAFTGRYQVRIFKNNSKFNDVSEPVRTPSFMPGLTVYIPVKRTQNIYDDMSYVSAQVFHHSNGQDGRTILSSGEFNYYNGNFSTNYFQLRYHKNWRKKLDQHERFNCKNPCNALTSGYRDVIASAGVEQHFGTAYALRHTYSRTRLNLQGGYIRVMNWRSLVKRKVADSSNTWVPVGDCYAKEKFRVLLTMSLNADKLIKPYSSLGRRLNIDLTGYYVLGTGNTSAFLAVGHYGNDPYNIYYSKSYPYIRGGLALGFFVHTNSIRR